MAEVNDIGQEDHNRRGYGQLDINVAHLSRNIKLKQLQDVRSKIQFFDHFMQDMEANRPLSYLRDRWNEVFGNAKDVCAQTANMLKSNKCLSPQDVKNVLNEIHQAKVKMANDMVTIGAVVSATIIIVQIWRLHKAWVTVKDARNIVDENRGKIDAIKINIDQLNSGATALQGLINEHENQDTNDQEKQKLLKSIRLKFSRMNAIYVKTRCLFSELKVRVDGKMQVLDIYKQEQASNGVCNIAHGVTNLIQCIQFLGLLSSGIVVLQGAITTMFFGLAAANASMCYMTGKALYDIREELKQIQVLEQQLNVILHDIHFFMTNERSFFYDYGMITILLSCNTYVLCYHLIHRL